MKRNLIFLIAVCLCAAAFARKFEVKTGTFSKLVVQDNLNVVYEHQPACEGIATFEWDNSHADALMFVNNGKDKLTVMISPDFIGKNIEFPVVYIYSEFLRELESSSESTVTVKKPARCPELKIKLFGNGTIDVSGLDANKITAAQMTGHGLIKMTGKTADAVYKVAGAGHIDACGLEAVKVSCHVFGGGEIHCHPIEEIKLKGLGSTTVFYSGNPTKVKKQGIGKLVKVGD